MQKQTPPHENRAYTKDEKITFSESVQTKFPTSFTSENLISNFNNNNNNRFVYKFKCIDASIFDCLKWNALLFNFHNFNVDSGCKHFVIQQKILFFNFVIKLKSQM